MSRITVTAPATTRQPDDWRDQSACRGEDPDLFFPYPTELARIEDAKAVCRGCPVWMQCLQWATEQGVEGIWGGTTEEERHRARGRKKRTRPQAPAQCGTEAGAQRHRRLHERVCDPCRRGERQAHRRREQAKAVAS